MPGFFILSTTTSAPPEEPSHERLAADDSQTVRCHPIGIFMFRLETLHLATESPGYRTVSCHRPPPLRFFGNIGRAKRGYN